jgi:TonB family protein
MLEATQTGPSQILFKAGRQWEDRVVGNFRLRQYLGSTDHSAVFLTELGGDQGQKAAIKLIAADPTTADIQLDRWRLAAKLSHPRLLQIFEVGKCQISGDDLLFIVMEYASENLSQILPERPLSDAEAHEMLKLTLEALAYLHENGFAHGRVKPANIMAVGEQLKLSSDGICRAGVPAAAGFRRGAYDAPEVEQEGLSTAGDVWSVGITLVEALTQDFPLWENRLVEEPTVPDSVHAPFLTIAHNCLLRDPRRRWTMSQIFTCLEPPAPAVPPVREVKSRPKQEKPAQEKSVKDLSTWIFAGAMVAVVLIALLVANLLHHRSHTGSGANATTNQAQNDSDAPITTVPVVQEHIVNQPLPAIPERALRTIHGKLKVMVRVHVDSSGKVAKAEFQSRGPSRYFAEHALETAQTWRFAPAQSDQRSRMWVLQFVFDRSGVTVHPRQVA